MAQIELGHGQFTIVDDEDYAFLSQWRWKPDKNGYAVRNTSINKKHITIRIHRLIMNTPDGMEVDHINGDVQDNRKSNLRNCTRIENSRNIRKRPGTLGYCGVRYRPSSSKRYQGYFEAHIRVDKKQVSLGKFRTAQEAETAYFIALRQMHGEFANIEIKK